MRAYTCRMCVEDGHALVKAVKLSDQPAPVDVAFCPVGGGYITPGHLDAACAHEVQREYRTALRKFVEITAAVNLYEAMIESRERRAEDGGRP